MAEKKNEVRVDDVLQEVKVALSHLVHQLSNEIGLISPAVDTIKKKYAENQVIADQEIEETLKELKEIGENSSEILSNYRELIRSAFNKDERISPVNINLIIQEIIRNFTDKSSNKELFKLSLTPELPDVRVKKENLVLAITNIIANSINAIQLKENNDGLIEIKSQLIGNSIAIDITDNGIGIPKNSQNLIFEFGFSTKGSTGMGLWITKNVLASLGGELTLIKSGDQGTTFRILLNKWTLPITSAGKRRLLIVDDDARWQYHIKKLLSDKDYEIYTANRVDDAIQLVKEIALDVALLDVRLADVDLNGLDIARMVREYNPEALIILISGYASSGMMKAAFDVGVDNYIPKDSLSIENLIETIDLALVKKIDEAAQRRETRRESMRREQHDRFIYETLSIFSHELRGPLLIAQRNAEVLNSGALGKMTKKQTIAVESIRSAIKREFTLLDTHLDLSRIERGLEDLHYESFDLVQLMREEIMAHEDAAKEKNIQIKSTLAIDKATVRIDINRFRAALNPLMDNAIKFSGENTEVSISMKLNDSYVEVYISDQGPGIKPEELDHLLGRSISSDTKLNQRIRASGLGLSLAKRIIEDYHEGMLWFVKKENGEKGTIVAFRISVLNHIL